MWHDLQKWHHIQLKHQQKENSRGQGPNKEELCSWQESHKYRIQVAQTKQDDQRD
jgi:hypothetical protein